MNPIAVISFALGLLFVTNLISLADEDTRCQSLGPLVHFDPNARRPRDLITVYGDPRLGLTANPSDNCERIGNSGKWFVGMNDSGCAPTNVAMMEADKETGRLRLRELFRLIDAADFSKDGRFVFGGRSKNEGAAEVWECFSLADDRAVWAVEKDVVVLDAMFSPDGSQVIVLHGLGKVGLHMQSAVSWYDTATGRRLRRIQLPGEADPGAGAWSRYLLTMSQDTLFIAKPCQDSGDFFMVPKDAQNAIPVIFNQVSWGSTLKLRSGGKNGELLAFYDDEKVAIERFENGRLKALGSIDLSPPDTVSIHTANVRFSPNGSILVASKPGVTVVVPLNENGIVSPQKKLPEGSASGDFTDDGKFFVFIDEGGGRVWDAESWDPLYRMKNREHPVHCCPITEAGYSLSGDLIVSSDNNKLLLWSKKGDILAQLISDRDDDRVPLRMQSAIIMEKERKIYAADGWHFLEWNLDEIEKRIAKKPVNVPRVKGTVVFNDRQTINSEPEIMNISMDSSGRNLITATGHEVRFRALKSPDESKILPVPNNLIRMKPRSFIVTPPPSKVFLHSSSLVFELDPNGVKEAEQLNITAAAIDPAADRIFSVYSQTKHDSILYSQPLGDVPPAREPPSEGASIPEVWKIGAFDSRLLLANHGSVVILRAKRNADSTCIIAVIDWLTKKTIWSEELPWEPRSVALSSDEKRLLIGSSNKALYVFDFEQIMKGS